MQFSTYRPRGYIGGLVRIAVGGTFLLQALGVPHGGPLLFLSLGLAFAIPYALDRRRFVYLAPAAALLGVGLGLLLPELLQVPDRAAGPLFLATLGAAFAVMFLVSPGRRWPLVVGSVFALLGVVGITGQAALIPDVLRSLLVPGIIVVLGVFLLLDQRS